MLVIGLTGGIGSGKSTVANLFAARGIPVIDTDIIARDLTRPGEPGLQSIIAHFGNSMLQSDGTLNRGKLRDLVFRDQTERRWLEALLHPQIMDRVGQLIKNLDTPYCIVVIPLLVETNANELIDRTLVVDAPEEKQKERVIARDKTTAQVIDAIMKTQASRQERLEKADDVILNADKPAALDSQVQVLHKTYLALATTENAKNECHKFKHVMIAE